MVHSVSGWTRGVQVKLWDPSRTRATPELLRGVFATRRYTNPRSPLPLPVARVFGRMNQLTCNLSRSCGGETYPKLIQLPRFFTYTYWGQGERPWGECSDPKVDIRLSTAIFRAGPCTYWLLTLVRFKATDNTCLHADCASDAKIDSNRFARPNTGILDSVVIRYILYCPTAG